MNKNFYIYNYIIENEIKEFTYQELLLQLENQKVKITEWDIKEYLEVLCEAKVLSYYCGEFFYKYLNILDNNSSVSVQNEIQVNYQNSL